jgi:formate-dependent nitrite reductase cytochrome c552 subunit
LKTQLVAIRGGRCSDCAYSGPAAAFDFHHRDPASKRFGIGTFNGTWNALLAEAETCDMLCANCHRVRHAAEDVASKGGAVVDYRRRSKVRAVEHMGGRCFGCERIGPPALFDFHHMDAKDKQFGIGQDGISRTWEKVVAELEKCVMLCANCHREVHAGVRTIRPTLVGLAEDALLYAA